MLSYTIGSIMRNVYSFSVGTCAYNEEKNISKFIKAVQSQKLPGKFELKEIIVVSSGSTDNTNSIVEKLRRKDDRIRLFTQKEREGKAVAVNIFIKKARSKLLFLQSADTTPSSTCYKYMLEKLIKPDIGIVGCRVVPVDRKDNFVGFANHFKWKLHHQISLDYPDSPKVGELISFKKIFERIPPESAVDEASIESLVHSQGYRVAYAPKAVVYNKGPENLREYLSGRRRIYAGHFKTKKKYAYEVVTFSSARIIPIFVKSLEPNPKHIVYAFCVALLEMFGRLIGYIDIKLGLRSHTIWKIANSAKGIV